MMFRQMFKKLHSEEQGMILVTALLIGLAFSIITVAIVQFTLIHYATTTRYIASMDALYAAEAGGDNVMYQLNNVASTYQGTTPPQNGTCNLNGSGQVQYYSNGVEGRATYETCVTSGTIASEKIVYATGRIYRPASATSPTETRKIKLTVEGSNPLSYAVETGPGGLIMKNNAVVGNGDVYVGGYIHMYNNSQIGTIVTPATVNVGDYWCPNSPPDSTYPSLCDSSTQPITTSNSAHIWGTVNANNETNQSGYCGPTGSPACSQPNGSPGLTQTSGVSNVTMPTYDRAGQKAAVTNIISGDVTCKNGTLTWQANTKIAGDVNLSNSCTVIIKGNVWVTGNFSMNNSAALNIDASVASTPVIMIDGSSGLSLNNSASISANASGIGAEFITFYSTASCSPDCTSVTGTDLYNSQQITTIKLNNSALAANSTFYAYWTKLLLENNGSLAQLLGQTIELDNSGNISFGTSTSVSLSQWDVRYYEQL